MSSEKRLALFLALTFGSIFAIQFVMEKTGLIPPPGRPRGQIAKVQPADDQARPIRQAPTDLPENVFAPLPEKEKPAGPAKPKMPMIAVAREQELILGSTKDETPDGYRLEVQLTQDGAGVVLVASSRYEAEYVEGQKKHLPLEILTRDPFAPPSLALTLLQPGSGPAPRADDDDAPEAKPDAAEARKVVIAPDGGEVPLDSVLWEVVRDDKGRAIRVVSKVLADGKTRVEGQELLFRTTVDDLGVTITKRYRLYKGEDGFELELGFASPERERSLVYRLLGPHGIPIEGEWYTGTFRDVYFGQAKGSGVEIVTKSAGDIAKPKAAEFDNTALPLRFAGVENQYFSSFIEPVPPPATQEERWDSRAVAIVLHKDDKAPQKADVGVEIVSRPVQVGPNRTVAQTYRVFAGPKTKEALAAFGAEGLAAYRKYQLISIPGASWMAFNVIAPLLDKIYDLTAEVARIFGGKRGGNYGIAIILLTMTVRMIMFPLGRKQALAAKKMQELQPYLKELQEKYKDDKEAQTRETFALWKRHGVNPAGGCLPALIQMPIFVGLWQALNNSVHLRHARFLWIENLAAPDMLFKIPFDVPLIGGFLGGYFNVLPILVVSLMLVQTKLFSPPPTTPEAEQQQKMMKYMMVFMAFMFYKVPSGLGIYFITSSLWAICERLLLPKVTHTAPVTADPGKEPPPGGGGKGGPGGNGNPGGAGPAKRGGWISQKIEKLLEEAAKDATIRNSGLLPGKEKDRDRDKDQDKGKPRARPNRRR